MMHAAFQLRFKNTQLNALNIKKHERWSFELEASAFNDELMTSALPSTDLKEYICNSRVLQTSTPPIPSWYPLRGGGPFKDMANEQFHIDMATNTTTRIPINADKDYIAQLESFKRATPRSPLMLRRGGLFPDMANIEKHGQHLKPVSMWNHRHCSNTEEEPRHCKS